MNPQATVTIFISAASDLMAERETLARMIATLPVSLAWRIALTPISGPDLLDEEALQAADAYFLLMGSDIRAPVGLEWLMARRAGRPTRAYLKRGILRTPAGQIFVSQAGAGWQPFHDAADLGRQIQRDLVQHLIRQAVHYALTPQELEQLQELLTSNAPTQPTVRGEEAGHSAVIL